MRPKPRPASVILGIMTVYDTGEDADGPFIVLELIEGQTVADQLAEAGAFNPADTVDIVSQLGSALDHAHAQGVVHRDIKPANLIIDPSGRVRLTDFGIAKTIDDPTTITAGGELVGTIAYMAPELLEGRPATSGLRYLLPGDSDLRVVGGETSVSAESPQPPCSKRSAVGAADIVPCCAR